jgi:hypothetical protein
LQHCHNTMIIKLFNACVNHLLMGEIRRALTGYSTKKNFAASRGSMPNPIYRWLIRLFIQVFYIAVHINKRRLKMTEQKENSQL